MTEQKNYRDPNARLQSALETLERFTEQYHTKKMIGFVAETFSYKVRKRKEKEQDTLLRALDDVKRYHALADAEIRKKVPETLREYNKLVKKVSEKPKAFRLLIGYSRLKNHTIELKNRPEKDVEKVSRKMVAESISEREADAFRMKAISLIRDRLPLVSEAFNTVRQTPIYIDPDQSDVIALHQTLTPFPGETVIMKGAFRRNDSGMTIPITDSFQIFSESNQTGFPHPSQHNGWALCDPLIPENPHRLDQMPILSKLLERKKRAAKELISGGSLLERGKELLVQKRNRIDLALHQKLCEAASVDELIRMYESINENLIIRPYQKLMQAWVDKSNPELLSNDPKKSYNAAKGILEKERKAAESGQHEFGKKVAEAAQTIILQHLSEVMEFPPPTLSLFEKKVQLCAYLQLKTFLDELDGGEINDTLKMEIEIFNRIEIDDPILKELECYYSTRHDFHKKS